MDTLDVTVEAQKVLSCIFRLKQRGRSGGRSLIAAILCGGQTEQIINGGYDTLSTYGIMKEYTQSYVRELIDYLMQLGYITEEPEYHTLCLTQAADELVKSRSTLLMKRPKRAASAAAPAAVFKAAPGEEDTALMQKLRELRTKQASILGVPAYVVFTDASLREMSVKKPRTMQEFLGISGVGSMKAQRYGRMFIAAVEEYLAQGENK